LTQHTPPDRQKPTSGRATPKDVDQQETLQMVFVLTHQLAIATVESDDAALGIVEAEAVSHVIERSVQLG
jgi:hypothetical protein